MDIKLQSAELKVMDVIWGEEEVTAKQISVVMTERYGWSKNTTYTLIKRCIGKGAVERIEPNFICRALVPREKIQEAETNELVDKVFEGSRNKLVAALLGTDNLTTEQIERLKQIVKEME